MTKPTTKQIVSAMLANGSPVKLNARNLPLFGGWCLEDQNNLPIGGAFKSHEAALSARSKAWFKAWENVA
jgi:hypothetical protein